MSRIESRPTGDRLGLYQFSIDLLGHIREARVSDALVGVHRVAMSVKFLGGYPSADATRPIIDPTTTDSAFAEATAWLTGVLDRDD